MAPVPALARLCLPDGAQAATTRPMVAGTGVRPAARAAALAIALERARISDVEAEALRNIHDECKTALSEAIVDATDARETATEEKAKAAKSELERDDANAISKSIKESLASVAATLTTTTSCLEETRGRVVRAEEKAAIKKC